MDNGQADESRIDLEEEKDRYYILNINVKYIIKLLKGLMRLFK